jgi:hypothetical protein
MSPFFKTGSYGYTRNVVFAERTSLQESPIALEVSSSATPTGVGVDSRETTIQTTINTDVIINTKLGQ